MSWTVVTVTYNSAETLRHCWRPADGRYEWIVVDNHSSDESASVAEALGAKVIRLPRNVGFSRANNLGAARATGDPLLFANPDLVIEPNDLPALERHLDRHGGLVAPQLLDADGTPQSNGRGFPYMTTPLGNRRLWPFTRLHRRHRIYAAPGEARWAAWTTGAALAVRRSDFDAIGRWDERFFLYYEDVEIGLRSWRHGRPVAVLGDVRWVHHWRRATNTFRWSRAHNLEIRAAITFYSGHPEFVLGIPQPRRKHPSAAESAGSTVTTVSTAP
jgi:GT2 family glycosyltransferase